MSPSASKKFSGIFVSYRREDSAGHAGRLFDRLVEHFGRERIFMDIDTIEPGEDFVTVIENAVSSCDVLIAIIGRNWLSTSGTGRLDKPNDFVRIEIATALRRDIRVIPVLVQRANIPRPQDLPEDLVKLTRRNAVELSDLRWQTDVDQLITVMERVLAKRAEEDKPLEESRVAEVPVRESNLPARGSRVDAPATTAPHAIPPSTYKSRRLMLISGAALIVLLAVGIIIWLSQRGPTRSDNANQAATAQPSVTQQPPAPTPTQTPVATVPHEGTRANAAVSGGEEDLSSGEATFWERRDNGDVLRIVRNGNSLKAFMESPSTSTVARGRRKGDLAFEGSFEGRTIRGTAYLIFFEKDVRRCPTFGGDQPFALELTLSADGNRLTGSREDYELSADCNIVSLPRKRLTYTKTSRL